MKKITLLFAFILALGMANAQDDYYNDEIQTIFSNRGNNGGYGSFSLGYSEIDGSDAFVGGMRGGFIFDHKFAIGLGGYGFINNLDNNRYDYMDNDMYLAGGYGGVFIEPIVGGTMPVHVSFPILFGIGGVSLTEKDYWDDWGDWDNNHYDRSYDSDVFFVVEPGIELEFNLARFFRLATSVTYRLTSDIELQQPRIGGSSTIDEDALRGLHFGMVFKFGSF